jgi:hypothetical protein
MSAHGHAGRAARAVGVVAACALAAGCAGQPNPRVVARGTSTASPDPTPSAVDVAGAPGVALALRGLERGRAPQVAWLHGTVLVVGTHRASIPAVALEDAFAVAPYGTGSVVLVWDYRTAMTWYDASGARTRTHRHAAGLAWSPLLGEVAWWNGSTRRAVVASSSSGKVLGRFDAPRRLRDASAEGWLGREDVVFQTGSWSEPGPTWRTGDQSVTRMTGLPIAASPVTGLVATAALQAQPPDITCLAVSSGDDPVTPLWQECLLRDGSSYAAIDGSFSPDGRLLLVKGANNTGGSRPFWAVLDAYSGAVVARFDMGRYGSDRVGAQYEAAQAVFEDDRHVLLTVADRTGQRVEHSREAIVRCDLTTVMCELATRTRAEGPDFASRPYKLTGSLY